MKSLKRLVLTIICKLFNKQQLLSLIIVLLTILEDKHPDYKIRDSFKEQHPHYREFNVDPLKPLDAAEFIEPTPKLDYRQLLKEYEQEHNKKLKPVNRRSKNSKVSKNVKCPVCSAPHIYLSYNNGKKRSQVRCKVCGEISTIGKRFKRKTKYLCPYCHRALYKWKEKENVTYYKCDHKDCPCRKRNLSKLNKKERKLRKKHPEHFKINYQYRDYHFKPKELSVAAPYRPTVDLNRIHNDLNVVGLVLTLHISYAITARKTADMLKNIWGINISHQTVLNYAEVVAYYCHKFNLSNKGSVDEMNAVDETYKKIKGIWHYVWLVIGTHSKRVNSYNLSDKRDTKNAIATLLECIRTVDENNPTTFISDGNPSYQAATHFVNMNTKDNPEIDLKTVIGLQNKDEVSKKYRPYKQMIERLNRTFNYHTRSQDGFNATKGAITKLVLFVTHYNFLRPHKALNYQTPVRMDQLSGIRLMQNKWVKIISLAA